jgi:2-dehydropantoate 2-reductase
VAGVAGFEAVLNGSVESATIVARGPSGATLFAKAAGCLTTDKLLGNPNWERLVRELMLEVIGAARALGYDVPESLADKQIERTRTMGDYKASTLLDFEKGLPLELESLFLEPLRQARQAGVSVPRLEAMCLLLQQLNPAKAMRVQ